MFSRFEEPLGHTLARNLAIAAIVGAVFALRGRHLSLFFPITALALWPTLGGHYVELAFLNGLRPQIPSKRSPQALARLLFWYGGGLLLYLCMVASARVLSVKAPPLRLWWCGGFLFIAVELVAHAVLALRAQPNFYNGRG